MLEQNQFKLLYELAQTAQRYSDQDDRSQATRLAAKGYLNDWKSPKRIDFTLEIAIKRESISTEMLGLLHLGNRTALHCVLDMIGSVASPKVAQSLRLFVRDSGIKELSQVISERSAGNWAALEPVFPILAQMPARDNASILIQLSRHNDHQVRGEALIMLCESTELGESAYQQIYRALCDNHERTQASAIHRLGKQKSPESIKLLGAYIERSLPKQPSDTFHCHQAVQILEGWGQEGLDRLCDALWALSMIPRPRNVQPARIVAQALEPKRDAPSVNRACKLWRFSPTRLVGFFSERKRHGGEGQS